MIVKAVIWKEKILRCVLGSKDALHPCHFLKRLTIDLEFSELIFGLWTVPEHVTPWETGPFGSLEYIRIILLTTFRGLQDSVAESRTPFVSLIP